MKRSVILIDLTLLEILSIILACYFFRGATSLCDGAMHLSEVKILLNNLKIHGYFPRWNPYWYFGVPMWRIYSPLSYYIVAFLGWKLDFSMPDIVMMWTYLVFSLTSISTYLLAREMGLKRSGCLISPILFLLSYNLIEYWGIGSYPNVTGLAFSPLALLMFCRAVKRRNLVNTLFAGLAYSVVVLTYFMNAMIVFVFIVVLSILMVIREPSLMYVSRGPATPPKYTLVLPKVLFAMVLIAVALSLWWALPFLITYVTAPSIPGVPESGVPSAPRSLEGQLMALLGVHPNIDSPGIGQFILAITACIVVFVKRKAEVADAPLCFLVAFIFCLAPWLRIPVGPVFWWRFTLYLSLFASICGGITFDFMSGFYGKFLGENSLGKYISRICLFSAISLVLLGSIYPVVGSESTIFLGFDISQKPQYVQYLEYHAKPGERVGLDGGYDFNLYTEIPQSGGGNIHYVYMVNEFAYLFWRYMFMEQDGRFLRYFARSYNVRWFTGPKMPGLTRTDPVSPYEVTGFNSKFAEITGFDSRLVLFIGEEREYSRFFTSIAQSNPEDIVPIYGANTLDEYDVVMLSNFDMVYLTTLRSKDSSRVSRILSAYVEGGGSLILDTGNVELESEMDVLPGSSPVETITYEDSCLMLNLIVPHDVTKDVDFSKFSTEKPCTISHGRSIKNGASVLVCDEDKPVLVFWEQGLGRVFWVGLRLPYMIMLQEASNDRTRSDEEAKFLVNLLRQTVSAETKSSKSTVRFEQPRPEDIIVHVRNGSSEDALWVKMSYYPGWTTRMEDDPQTLLKIFRAGPNMMLVFPKRSGDYSVRFYFDKTTDVKVGEFVSLMSILMFPIAAFHRTADLRRKRQKH